MHGSNPHPSVAACPRLRIADQDSPQPHHTAAPPPLTMRQQAKVLAIRAALAQGCYDVQTRLDAAIDRLAADL